MKKATNLKAVDAAEKDGEETQDLPMDMAKDIGGVAGKRLRAFIERVERLTEEKGGLGDDIKDVWAEAKGVGFDTKIMKRVLKLRKMETQKRREEEELLQLYLSAIGME